MAVCKTLSVDTNLVKGYNSLGREFIDSNKDSLGLLYYHKAIDVATKCKDFKGSATSYWMIANYHFAHSDFSSAKANFRKSISEDKKANNFSGIANTYGNLGSVYHDLSQYDSALFCYKNSLNVFDSINDRSGFAGALSNIGNVYSAIPDYSKALEYYFEAERINREISNLKFLGVNLGNIGIIYKNQNDFDRALDYFNQALKINRELDYKRGIAINLGNIGVIYKKLNQNDKALEHYKQAYDMHAQMDDRHTMATVLINIGNIYTDEKKYSEAIEHFEKAIDMAQLSGNKRSEALAIGNIGTLFQNQYKDTSASTYMNRDLIQKSIRYLSHSVLKFEENGELQHRSVKLKLLSDAYADYGDFKNAYKYNQYYNQIHDSIFNTDQTKNLEQLKYQQIMHSDSLRNELAQSQLLGELHKEKFRMNVLIGLGLMILLMSIGLFSRINYIKKSRAALVVEKEKSDDLLDKLQDAYKTISVQNERMSGELNVAKDIQMSMLPLIFPAFPKRADIDIHAHLIPAREVGGDFYDFFFIDDQHLCMVVGDVSGKGVPAALMMAVCKTVIKSRASNDLSPASILTHVNNEMARENNNYMFITVFLAIMNTYTGELTYCNAGHNPTYIIRNSGEIEKLAVLHGPVIAAMEEMSYSETTISIEKYEIIFAYTDGIPEAHNSKGELYSDQRLQNELRTCSRDSSQKLIEDVLNTVYVFEGDTERFDDITALSIRYIGSEQETTHKSIGLKIANDPKEIDKLIEKFEAFGEANNIDKNIRLKGNVVFDELITNIINYAYEDDLKHVIDVSISLNANKLAIKIMDDGKPFNPFVKDPPDIKLSFKDREIGGLGIHLVKNLMDEYHYKRLVGKNVITLVKFDVVAHV
jgi:sigma-B regulation protein RsbU (phosphoserine phosphatase)